MDYTIYIIGLAGTISSIFFAYLAFKKSEKEANKEEGKSEGALMSDIGYIKSSIHRMERKLDRVEEQYSDLLVRLIKIEDSSTSLEKRLEQHIGDKIVHNNGG